MKDDLERVRQLGHDLLVQLQQVTHSVRIGERPAGPQPPLAGSSGPYLPSPSF